jgi:hypothetical protein
MLKKRYTYPKSNANKDFGEMRQLIRWLDASYNGGETLLQQAIRQRILLFSYITLPKNCYSKNADFVAIDGLIALQYTKCPGLTEALDPVCSLGGVAFVG